MQLRIICGYEKRWTSEVTLSTGGFTGPDLSFRRRACCLCYRVPGGSECGDCVLTL
ncbi:(2Fe-2S)-binding protein [Nonomuraea sp. NPDC000554]|uniref:(2Fe-2S)-binding protein n=1 Tax=Nonomuraea sp. NPDC000554 TaxID=3154259 RepID=UPI00332EEFA6